MGRTMKPNGLRRSKVGGDVEVRGTSGYWIGWGVLSSASRDATMAVYGPWSSWPKDTFEWGDPPKVDDLESEQASWERLYQEAKAEESQASESASSDSDNESESESDSDQDDGPLEKIVKELASKLDRKLAKELTDMFVTHPQLEERLVKFADQFQPKTDVSDETMDNARLATVIVKVEVAKNNEIVLSKDGLFHNQFPKLVQMVKSGQHSYLPGPPGTGKSHAAEQVADMLGWHFGSISLGPQTPDSRLWGGMDAHGNFHDTMLTRLMIHAEENPDSGSVFCLDELDNGNSGNIATLNSAMANGWTTLPNGRTVRFGGNMVFVGCANTYGTGPTSEFAGRNKLDAATLDRFVYLPWDTDKGVETALVRQYLHGENTETAVAWLDVWRTARKNVDTHGLKFFVTMRGCVNGAKMIANGVAIEDAFMLVLGNRLPKDQFVKINPL